MMTDEEIDEIDRKDTLTDYISQLEDCACMIAALGKERQTNEMSVVYVDDDGNDASLTVYDFYYHTWKSTDTLDKLANDLLGNADYGTAIAYFNGIENESDIEAGTKIKIPVLSEDAASANNRIYAAPEKQENYGSDMTLNDEGDLAVKGGDIATVSGKENLTQAIALRLTTAAQKRIRLSAYGIRSSIGEPMAIESYLTGSIEQTIKADPRISEVDEITFKGDGDTLRLEVKYTDINGESGAYKGEI